MKPFLWGLLALMPAAALDGDPEPVAIFSEFEHEPPPAVTQALRSELEVIMGPAGYSFDWHSLKQADGRETYPELVVVSFKGECSAPSSIPSNVETGALGWTHRSGSELLPFTGVDCTRIQKLIAADLAGIKFEEREETVGRALGRVLAHELYHILGKTSRHGSDGIAKAFYSSRELTAESLRLRDRDSQLLRSRRQPLLRLPAVRNSLR